jgi:hypothetical protein
VAGQDTFQQNTQALSKHRTSILRNSLLHDILTHNIHIFCQLHHSPSFFSDLILYSNSGGPSTGEALYRSDFGNAKSHAIV